MTPPDHDLGPMLEDLRPSEVALRDWVRTRFDASIVRDIATFDYGMNVEQYEHAIEDLVMDRRLPAGMPWPAGAVLEMSGNTSPDATDQRGHVARLFSCMIQAGTGDTLYPAGALAGLVESALVLGPEATAPALRFVAWCRQHERGSWREQPGSRPLLTLGLLVLYAANPDHDPAVVATLLDVSAAEVRAAVPDGEPPFASFKAACGGERRRTWRALAAPYLTGHDPAVATLRPWLKMDPPAKALRKRP
ncbi:hypothetical protein OHA72_42260 [Dactylosporangium sp. NBC_01737]|uniref:hypothetical protein n=1 Tax=Dactylosporangium sp. NBC_01737 TaxID=2975959 RepID=UPI002E0E1588|nr:hypothetical protein OHA72_42260 [Dactylosporangium sp. NBC_01737]